MTTIQRANFEDIRERYFQTSQAAEAVNVLIRAIKKKKEQYLATLLRDYRERGVWDSKEIELRAAVDAMLIGYSVMEIAALAGFILPENSTFWEDAGTILSNSFVRRYYVEFYPIQLPKLLLFRLQGKHTATVDPSTALTVNVLQFLELDHRFMQELNDSELLRMLDSFWYGGVGFPDIVKLIGRQDDFVRSILTPPEERKLCEQVVHQFSAFMEFCLDLQRLLDQLSDHRMMQSEIWHHYSYWFGIIGTQMQAQLGSALDQFLAWEVTDETNEQANAIKEYVAKANGVIKRLVEPKYGEPVQTAVAAAQRT